MRTYQVLRGRRWHLLSEARSTLRAVLGTDPAAHANELVRRADQVLVRVNEAYGVDWSGKHLLDVGAGQRCVWSLIFGRAAEVTAIDLDVIPRGFDPGAFWTMAKSNGLYRTFKTAVRRLMGVDRRHLTALERVMGCPAVWPTTYTMDAHHIGFADGSFDGAFSFSAFEHVGNPQQVMREIHRVLKPGGVCYISLELFSSIAGSHDPRLWGDLRALPLWAHLRPSCAGSWQANVFVNNLRMADFEAMARDVFDEAVILREERGTRKHLNELSSAERAELSSYTDEELCTQDLIILGRKR